MLNRILNAKSVAGGLEDAILRNEDMIAHLTAKNALDALEEFRVAIWKTHRAGWRNKASRRETRDALQCLFVSAIRLHSAFENFDAPAAQYGDDPNAEALLALLDKFALDAIQLYSDAMKAFYQAYKRRQARRQAANA